MRTVPVVIIACAVLASFMPCEAGESRMLRDYNQGRFDTAVQEYRQAAETGGLEETLDLAVVLKDLGEYDQASYILYKARDRFGQEPALLSLLARLYYLNGKSSQALTIISILDTIVPGDLETQILAGLCYESLGKEDLARQAYEKAAAIDGNNIIVRLSLAQLYLRQNRLAESAENFRKVSVLDASIGKVYGCWADVLYRLGRYREAFRLYEKTLLIDPASESVREKVELARAKLGEDFFKDQHEKVQESRKEKDLTVVPARSDREIARVTVGLVRGFTGRIKFKCAVPFNMTDASGNIVAGAPHALYEISSGEGRVRIAGERDETLISSTACVIRPGSPEGCVMFFSMKTGGGSFWADLQDRSFRGTIEAKTGQRRGIDLVNRVTLEEYLYSVVPSEMPSSWPLEALKAQAVAARSEALRKLGRHKTEGFDFCAEVHCQSYYGVEKETDATRQAVDETAGVVMKYNGKPVDGIYSSNCGGHTQDNIFGEGQAIPYLKGVPEADAMAEFPLAPWQLEQWLRHPPKGIYCDPAGVTNPSSFRWVRIYSADELSRSLEKVGTAGKIARIQVTRRNKSGHAEEVRVRGSAGTIVLKKEGTIRKALGDLRSSLFKVEVKYGEGGLPEQFIFYGGGWGHGVGMCQSGACGLALKGKDYKEILRHYFNGIDFQRIY